MNYKQIEDLVISGRSGTAQVVHAREIAALIESFGCNDRVAESLGHRDIFEYARELVADFQPDPKPALKRNPGRLVFNHELKCAGQKLCQSLAYAIPWFALVLVEYLRPNALNVSPQLGACLSLSLIASLVLTGGFIQTITRAGTFYRGLGQPALAHYMCTQLLSIGLTFSLALTLIGILCGFYFHLFSSVYLLLAAINCVVLSLLWLLCAILSVQGRGWAVPLIYFVAACMSVIVQRLTRSGTALLLILWPMMAVTCAFAFSRRRSSQTRQHEEVFTRPRTGVLSISLVPFFLYGTVYFGFLFADRIAAGSAIPWVSGLSFGIDPAYKHGMDIVLLAFLVTAALIEYLSDSLLRYWYQLAADLPVTASAQLIGKLKRRRCFTMLAVSAVFTMLACGAWYLFSGLSGFAPSLRLIETSVIGGVGYLLLCIALLEIVTLASVNATSTALKAVSQGLAVNLIVGYTFAHVWGVTYAAVGLLAGSVVVLWQCSAAVKKILQSPDFHYSIA